MEEKEIKTCEEYVLKQLFEKEEELSKADELLEKAYYEKDQLKNSIESLKEELRKYDKFLKEILKHSIVGMKNDNIQGDFSDTLTIQGFSLKEGDELYKLIYNLYYSSKYRD